MWANKISQKKPTNVVNEESISKLEKLDLNNEAVTSKQIDYFYSSESATNRLGMVTCKRPDNGGIKGRKTKFKINFYPIEIDYSVTAFQYNVEIESHFTRKDGTKGSYTVKKDVKNVIFQKIMKKHKINEYAYDGDKILFTTYKLENLEFELSCENELKETDNYKVILTQTSKVDLNEMYEYMSNRSSEYPKTCVNLLDVVYRQNKIETHVFEKRSMFNIHEKGENLGDGLMYYQGQYQSVKACQLGWIQNFDLESCVFYKPLNLVDFLRETLGNNIDLNREMSLETLKKFERIVKGLLIQPIHLDKPKKFKINKLTVSANSYEFDLNKDDSTVEKITVAKYFQTHHKQLRYPNMPCVSVGDPKRPICFPIEVCKLAEGQRYLKKLNPNQQTKIAKGTVFSPADREYRTNKLLAENKYDRGLLSKFGLIEPSSVRQMLEVKARVLEPPNVYYNDMKPLRANNGKWRMMNKRFINTIKLEKWICIWMTVNNRLTPQDNKFIRDKFLEAARISFTKNGLLLVKPPIVQVLDNKTVEEIFDLINKNCPNPQLVIMIIEDNDDHYAKIKSNAEKKFGITTQCLKYSKLCSQMDMKIDIKNTKDDYKLDMYLSNVALKINAKIGGTNNLVDLSNIEKIKIGGTNRADSVMFMGADVTNFGNNVDRHSIASLVGSRDLNFTSYCVRLSEQKNSNENRKSQEIILELEEMAYLLIKSFQTNNKLLPKRIIFYRDGVDSGSFQKVLDHEIVSLRNACKRLDFNPKITMIIVQKRHHTRIFPIQDTDKVGKHGNIPSGSVIDTEITSKDYFDFYLCSHEAIQGTAKATHYVVIHDENEFNSDDIEYLTFDLCHLYANSTKSVSLPAPVYYAHLAAYRGRLYEKSNENDDDFDVDSLVQDEQNEIKSRLIEIHPNLEEKMFFN